MVICSFNDWYNGHVNLEKDKISHIQCQSALQCAQVINHFEKEDFASEFMMAQALKQGYLISLYDTDTNKKSVVCRPLDFKLSDGTKTRLWVYRTENVDERIERGQVITGYEEGGNSLVHINPRHVITYW